MDSLETFRCRVRNSSQAGILPERMRTISSLKLAPAIRRMKVLIRPEDSLFQMAIILRNVGTKITTIDIADMRKQRKPVAHEILISIKKEQYIPELLGKLWERYGRQNTSQPDRWTVAIHKDKVEEEAAFLGEMKIADPRHKLHENPSLLRTPLFR